MDNKKKTLLILILISLAVLIFNPKTLNFIQNKMWGSEKNVANIMELELPHSSQIIYVKHNDDLLQYWDGILYSYNMNGKQNWSINLSVTNPIIESNNKNIFVVDKNKNQIIMINNNGEINYRVILEKNIGFIKSEEEDYLLVYHDPGKSVFRDISILNEKGNKVGEILLNEGEVINGVISKKNQKVILHTMGISDGKLEGKLGYYNLKGELITLESTDENIIVDMFYDINGNLVVVYEESVLCINDKREEVWRLSTDKVRQVLDTLKDSIVIYCGKDGKSGIIQGRSREKITITDLNGKILGEKIPSEKIIGLDTYKGDIVAYSNRTIYMLNKKGDIVVEEKVSNDIEQVFLLPQRVIAITTKEKLVFMKIQ